MVVAMSDADDAAEAPGSQSHLARWIVLIALAVLAAAFGRQMAIGSADKKFEQRLRELDDNRN
jgi:hypothetical protein